MQPSSSDGAVDLNLIPPSLIQSVEVITGGASSTYGSDAVAGVVNIKLRDRFTGLQLDGTTGLTTRGDGNNSLLGITGGTDFGDGRGNAYLSLNYSSRDEVLFRSRDYLANQQFSTNTPGGLITAVASNLPSQAAVNTVFSRYGITSPVSRSSTFSFNQDGSLYVGTGAINYRGSRSSPQAIYTGNVYTALGDYQVAQVPLTRYNAFGHASYQLTDNLTAFVEGLYTHYRATYIGPPIVYGSVSSLPVSVPVTNPFVSPDLRSILQSRPNPTAPFLLAQQLVSAGNRYEQDTYDVYQLTAGLNGKLSGGDLTWNVYVSDGRTKQRQAFQNYFSSLAIQRLVSAPDGGSSFCSGGFNFNNIAALSQSCLDYVKREAVNRIELKQRVIEANLQGGLFNLPAGQVRFAVGADYRRNSYSYVSDALIQSGELANFLPIFPSSGSDNVKEVYGELLIPLIHNAFFARDISATLAYRRSDYRVSGGIDTYKGDLDWNVTDWLRVRGGYARAVRAPSVGELFTATSSGLFALGAPGALGSGDPCDTRGAYRAGANAAAVRALCLAQGVPASAVDSFQNIVTRTPFTTSGNPALKPESSDTWSAGIVFRSRSSSPWLSRLTASVDFYKIRLKGAIGTVTNAVATSQCFDATVNSGLSASNFYCGLITRDPSTGQITNILNPSLNLGGYDTRGVDFAIDWSVPVSGDVRIGINSVASYLDRFRIQTLPSGPTLEYAGTIGNTQIDPTGTAKPTWKATTTLTVGSDRLQAGFRWRYLDGMDDARNVGTGGALHGVPSVSYFDLDTSFRLNDRFSLRGGVTNLFDRKPPVLNDNLVGAFATDLNTYDLLGRRFYITAQAKF